MEALVRDLMTQDPFTLGPKADLAEVSDLMDTKRIRHLPVVTENRELLGLISHRDLLKSVLHEGELELPVSEQRKAMREYTVDQVMIATPESVNPDDDIQSAGEMMLENKFGCLPVVEENILVGILTEADFVRYLINNL